MISFFKKNKGVSNNDIKKISLPEEYNLLYEEAIKSFDNAYAPYSNFKVSACLKLKDGNMIVGVNVENASYGLTMCAERNALFTAYAKGYRKNDIHTLLIVGDTVKPISPCGACRQVINELVSKDVNIVLCNLKKDTIIYKANELLPYSFTEDNLNE